VTIFYKFQLKYKVLIKLCSYGNNRLEIRCYFSISFHLYFVFILFALSSFYRKGKEGYLIVDVRAISGIVMKILSGNMLPRTIKI